MKWFGWIPTLAGKEVFPTLCREFLKEITGGGIEDGMFIFRKKLYDVKKMYCSITISLKNGYITSVKISDDTENKTIVRAENVEFYENGLVSFTIFTEVDEKIAAMQVFRIIRDIYHVHTHHKHQDVLLEPVTAENVDEAIDKIVRTYLKKIVDYLKEIKHRADTFFLKYCSVLTIEDTESLISQALGEMIYAENFCELFNRFEKTRFERTRTAIEALRDRVRVKYYTLTLILAFLTLTFTVTVELPDVQFYKILYLSFPAVSLSILFSSLIPYILRTVLDTLREHFS